MHAVSISAALGSAVLLTLLTFNATADAGLLQCQRAITAGTGGFARARINALRKCEERVVKGKLPLGTDCQLEPNVMDDLSQAESELTTTIAEQCGGQNRTCDAADTGENADVPLDAVGWNIGTCPNFENSADPDCAKAIADCNDIAACLECVGKAATHQAIALYYGALNLPSRETNRDLNRCQVKLGSAAGWFFRKKVGALGGCEGRIRRGAIPGPCPDATAQEHIAKAKTKMRARICFACGGADRACDGGNDFTPGEIGFVSDCRAVTVPGPGGMACGRPITTLDDIVTCVDCVSEFKVDCLDAISVLHLKSYPPECNPTPNPTPSP